MGFFDQDNEKLETVWFSVLAALSLLCFPFGVRLGQRFPQIPAAKFVVSPPPPTPRPHLGPPTQ